MEAGVEQPARRSSRPCWVVVGVVTIPGGRQNCGRGGLATTSAQLRPPLEELGRDVQASTEEPRDNKIHNLDKLRRV